MKTTSQRNSGPRLVDRPTYSLPSESAVLQKQVRQHNEATCDRGLSYLRSLLNKCSAIPLWRPAVMPILHAVNGPRPAESVKEAKHLLSQSYESAGEQFIASQVALFVKKFPFQGSQELAEANGLKKFKAGEFRNSVMNKLIRWRRSAGTTHPGLGIAREYIRRLMGDDVSWREVTKQTGWGPGSTVGVTGRFTNFARKLLADEWTITPAALPYFLTSARRSPMFWELLGLTRFYSTTSLTGCPQTTREVVCVDVEEFDRRFLKRVRFVDYNKLGFVPKDADCDRTIASEPLCNSWLQKGLDEYLKLRLRRFGIDLRKQEPNQQLAREGSLEGVNPYCTIDLANASGSICTEIVRELIPPGWFSVLNSLRSPAWRLPESEESVKYHGFVSMGNGFCFPLETIIFAGICHAAHVLCGTKPDFRCYGDDIIVRQNEALLVLELLEHCGFSANRDKTFIFGPFRESCGADWYSGRDVRPIYLDTPLSSFEERIRLHNAFARLPNEWAPVLASLTVGWFPPFSAKFVRPYPGDTDEALDGRHLHWVGPRYLYERKFNSIAWYGLSFNPVKDDEIEGHGRYSLALMYGALSGSSSDKPFAERRETSLRVARFSHSGNTSNWLPLPAPLLAVPAVRGVRVSTPTISLANLVFSRSHR